MTTYEPDIDFITIVPYLINKDCSALRAPAILKTFEIRPFRAAFSCFAGPKVISYKKAIQNAIDNHKTQMYLRFELQNSVKQHLESDEYQENLKIV